MKRSLTICWMLVGSIACSTPTAPKPAEVVTATQPEANQELAQLLDELWALSMRTFPGWATYEGVRDYDDRLRDASDQARDAYLAEAERIAGRIAALDRAALSPIDRDTQRMVVLSTENARAALACKSEWWDVNGLGGPQVDYLMMPVFFPVRNEADLANLEKRYRATDAQISQLEDHLRRGVKNGYAPTKTNVKRAIQQLDDYLESPIDADPMLLLKDESGVAVLPTASLRDAVTTVVRPALERYRKLLRTVVLTAARTDRGIADLPTGEECYAALMQSHIGPGYTAQGLHDRGLAELSILHAGMVEIGREVGIENPTPKSVMAYFADNKSYYATTEAELLEKNATVMARAQAAMTRAFGRLPVTPIEMRAIEAHRAKDAPAAYYYSAPEDLSRPAYYYVNASEPQTRPLYNLEALAFHEAIPGHHQQIALAKEIPNVHIWRRNAGQTAFVEGWALYAEVLADELGLYTDAVTRFGMYNYQAWRAARLVIDTGLHAKGWTRKQAIGFLAANTALPSGEIENEIDRYIAWPGQALAYMVGRMKIQELRADSQRALGDAFSLREFHDAVNANGAVPLTILSENIHAWTQEMSDHKGDLPEFKELWDFDNPVGTRAKFTALLDTAAVAAHPTYRQQLLTQIARTHSLNREFEDAHSLLDSVQKELGDAEPIVDVRYRLERGRTYNSAKDKDNARPLFEQAWEAATRAHLDGLAVDAAHMMGIVETGAESIAWNERALAYAEASDDPAAKNWLGTLYNNMGWTYHDGGKHAEALVLFQKALTWHKARGNGAPTRIAKWAVARALRSLGRTDEALAHQRELEKECEAAGKPDGFVFEELGELYLAAGDEQLARQYFAAALPLLEKLGWVEAERLDRIKKLAQ